MTEWITVKEAARQLSESERNVRLKIQNGKLKARRDGRRWLVHSSLSKEVTEETAAEQLPTGSHAEAIGSQLAADNEVNVALQQELNRVREELHESEKKATLVDELTKDKERLQGQVDKLQEEMSGVKERSDTIILQLTRQNQLLLEDKSTPWYRRVFRKREKEAERK